MSNKTSELYLMKTKKLDELKEGRTITYLSSIIKISRPILTDILNGKVYISKTIARRIVLQSSKNSINLQNKMKNKTEDEKIEMFFQKNYKNF